MDLVKNACFLYVEDDASNRMVMSLIMQKAIGTQNLVIFENSAEFMTCLKAIPKQPDVILLDILVIPSDCNKIQEMFTNATNGNSKMNVKNQKIIVV